MFGCYPQEQSVNVPWQSMDPCKTQYLLRHTWHDFLFPSPFYLISLSFVKSKHWLALFIQINPFQQNSWTKRFCLDLLLIKEIKGLFMFQKLHFLTLLNQCKKVFWFQLIIRYTNLMHWQSCLVKLAPHQITILFLRLKR